MDLKARYLHLETKQTPMEIPYDHNRAVYQDSYPEQNQEFLNKRFNLTFRDLRQPDTILEEFEEKEVRQRIFKCIRWDVSEPKRCVFVSEDFEYIVQFTVENVHPFSVDVYNDTEGYLYSVRIINSVYEQVAAYPEQEINVIGLAGTIQYGWIFNDRMLKEDTNPQKAIVLMSTLCEPLSDIFITINDEDNTFKVYDGSEVWFKIDEDFVPPQELQNLPSTQKIVKYREYYFRGRVPYGIHEDS